MNKILMMVLAGALATASAFAAETKKAEKASPAQAALHEKFAALDRDDDGAIEASEAEAYAKAAVAAMEKDGKKLDAGQAAEVRASLEKEFKRQDASGDGKISEAEFGSVEARPITAPPVVPAAPPAAPPAKKSKK